VSKRPTVRVLVVGPPGAHRAAVASAVSVGLFEQQVEATAAEVEAMPEGADVGQALDAVQVRLGTAAQAFDEWDLERARRGERLATYRELFQRVNLRLAALAANEADPVVLLRHLQAELRHLAQVDGPPKARAPGEGSAAHPPPWKATIGAAVAGELEVRSAAHFPTARPPPSVGRWGPGVQRIPNDWLPCPHCGQAAVERSALAHLREGQRATCKHCGCIYAVGGGGLVDPDKRQASLL
jgi:hypothetical protein